MFTHILAAQVAALSVFQRLVHDTARRRRDGGQSTAEYALVLLGAAAIAVVFIGWASKSNLIGNLFNKVLRSVIGEV